MKFSSANHPWLPAPVAVTPVVPTPPASAGATSAWLVEFHIGLGALPYLGDHGFHDMVILPGAFQIELARQVHRQLFEQEANFLRQIEFEKPVILTDDVAVTIRVEKRDSGVIAYTLFEATSEAVQSSPAFQSFARLQIQTNSPASLTGGTAARFQTDEFVTGARLIGDQSDFYSQLRRNGNQFGAQFQTLESVWKKGPQVVGRFVAATPEMMGTDGLLVPTLLDAGAQLLATFSIERGRTFILKSIASLIIHSLSGPGPWWIRADQSDPDQGESGGAIEAVDAHGSCLWELSGVVLAFIDPPASEPSIPAEETPLCIASTFTAEPLEESLRFWAGQFGRPVRIDFAPYNQPFQQLLDPGSAFRQNDGGINLIVLGLEDWLHADPRTFWPADPARASCSFGTRQRTVLPNGLEIVGLHRYETDYLYQEIFADQSYLRHGIQLADGDTVIDIGANIGLFSLFVLSRCKDPAIYAYEPSPRVFELLQANFSAYGDPTRLHAFNSGVAAEKGHAQFTFYENSSVFSSFHPDAAEDRAAVQAVVRNVLEHEVSDPHEVRDADVQELMTDRLRAETIDCPLTSVSAIIRENGLQRINLLKVDAEKSESEIIRGIEDEHWPLIDQLVIEVHDRTRAAVHAIEEMLNGRGYRCAVVEEKLLEDSGLFNIYATRRDPAPSPEAKPEEELARKVDEFCTALDTFSRVASTPLVLAITPRSAETVVLARQAALNAAENQLLACAAQHPHIRPIRSQAIAALEPEYELHDPHGHQLGHMPFTPGGYAAIGTALFRAVFDLSAPPIKVIVLDCDNTLWQGLCGEDGPEGIAITPPFRHLQEFMVAQMQAGVLLTLCSKNHEADALAVFERRTDMPLRREHFAAWRINWESKSDNLGALARQLNLGLDSFVFIDDNPVECAAVRVGRPEVIVLQLPQESERIPSFLERVWIFDRATASAEDRERTQWYLANTGREEDRAAAPSLQDFLNGLALRIDVTEAHEEQLARVSQLTMRTNQFNLTSTRRSEAEIRALVKSGATCLVTSVSDRFGDYGLVGAILYTTAADRYIVDTLLLSCRALGKGVEHRMVAELAKRALHDGKAGITLAFRPTDRNQPARDFVAQLTANQPASPDGSIVVELSSAALAELRYAPDEQSAGTTGDKTGAGEKKRSLHPGRFDRTNLTAAMQRLGDEFDNIDSILTAIESARQQSQPLSDSGEEEEKVTPLERALAAIWKKALGRTSVGYNESFVDAGGTSLNAVVVAAMIRKELKKDVSILTLFEFPTIKLLAANLEQSSTASGGAPAAEAKTGAVEAQKTPNLLERVYRFFRNSASSTAGPAEVCAPPARRDPKP